VIELHRPKADSVPAAQHAEAEAEMKEWTKDNAEMVEDHVYGQIVAGAAVFLNAKGNVITSYAGHVRTFTMVGALKYLQDRIHRDHHGDD
jgi:hypothetical protein